MKKEILQKKFLNAGLQKETIDASLLRLGDEGIEEFFLVLNQLQNEELIKVVDMLSKLPMSACPKSESKMEMVHEYRTVMTFYPNGAFFPVPHNTWVPKTKKTPDKGLLAQIGSARIENQKNILLTLASIPTDELNIIWQDIDEGVRGAPWKNFDFSYLFWLLPEEILSILRNTHQSANTPYGFALNLESALYQKSSDRILNPGKKTSSTLIKENDATTTIKPLSKKTEISVNPRSFYASQAATCCEVKHSFPDSLHFNGVTDELLNKIRCNKPDLIHLCFQDSRMGDDQIKRLAAALANNHTVISLNLNNVNMYDGGLDELAEALKTNKTLKNLDIRNNHCSYAGSKNIDYDLQHRDYITLFFMYVAFSCDEKILNRGLSKLKKVIEQHHFSLTTLLLEEDYYHDYFKTLIDRNSALQDHNVQPRCEPCTTGCTIS